MNVKPIVCAGCGRKRAVINFLVKRWGCTCPDNLF